jgi:drug/metabolite transporter (DMT)-like permease
MRKSTLVPLAFFSLLAFWGPGFLAIRIGLEGFPPLLFMACRFLLAGSILFAFLLVKKTPLPTVRQWPFVCLQSLLLMVGGGGGVAYAQLSVGSGLAAVGIATVPIWAALFTGLFGRWPSRVEWIGIAIGFSGVLLLSLRGELRADPRGALLLLASSLAWALGSILSCRLPLPGGTMAAASEMLVGGIMMVLLGTLVGERMTSLPPFRALAGLLYISIPGSVVAFSAYLYLLENVRPALATSYTYINPAIALALGVSLAGETVTLAELAAVAAILCGVAVIVLSSRDRGPSPSGSGLRARDVPPAAS